MSTALIKIVLIVVLFVVAYLVLKVQSIERDLRNSKASSPTTKPNLFDALRACALPETEEWLPPVSETTTIASAAIVEERREEEVAKDQEENDSDGVIVHDDVVHDDTKERKEVIVHDDTEERNHRDEDETNVIDIVVSEFVPTDRRIEEDEVEAPPPRIRDEREPSRKRGKKKP